MSTLLRKAKAKAKSMRSALVPHPAAESSLPPPEDASSVSIPSSSLAIINSTSALLADASQVQDLGSQSSGSGWEVFMQVLGVLKEVSVVFPPLQAAAAGLFRVLEQFEAINDARDDFRIIADRLQTLAILVQRYEGRTDDEDIQNRLEGMTAFQTAFIQKKLAARGLKAIANSPDPRDVLECIRAISFLVSIFEMDTALSTERKSGDIKNVGDAALSLLPPFIDSSTTNRSVYIDMLEKLGPVEGSCYDDIALGDGSGSNECMPGTRVGILTELMAWATDPKGPPIYLLTGMAGTGKSAIARTFAKLLDHQALLGASFFCSRASQDRSNAAEIIPSVAFRLAWHSQAYAEALIHTILNAPGVNFKLKTPRFQFTTLIMQPSHAFTEGLQVPIVVIDALDECANVNAVRELVGALMPSGSNASKEVRVKFFLTSRPESRISTSFGAELTARCLRLHDVEHEIVIEDIRKYLKKNLNDIAQRMNSPQWPSDVNLEKLYLSGESLSKDEIQGRLDNILSNSRSSQIQTGGIDSLYHQILNAAWAGKEPEEQTARRHALKTILCLRELLSLSGISALQGEQDPDKLKLVLADFHSVIDIPSSSDLPVRIFHASFSDYLTTRNRSQANWLDIQESHGALALQCLRCMNGWLHENICSIARGEATSTIRKDVVEQAIPSHFQYASIHWAAHLSLVTLGTPHSNIISELHIFSTKHMLHWLECLSLMGKLDIAVDCLQKTIMFTSRNCAEIGSLVDELRRMIPQIYKFARVYPLEVYHSALAWLPLQSKIRETYDSRTRSVFSGLREQWESCEQVLAQGDGCNSVAFSLDGVYLAGGGLDGLVRIWTADIGQMRRELVGHLNEVTSVTFSPDAGRIVSGSWDGTIRIWNASTGETEHELSGHSTVVRSVAFSPDGTRIASRSHDKTVRIWTVSTAEAELELVGHSNKITSVVFSPDGKYLASGSYDKTVRIWNLTSSKTRQEFTGHDDSVETVAFSPDGTHIASGSGDNTIRLWNISTGETECVLTGHSNWVLSVAFAPDGARLASASHDRRIKIWNVSTGEIDRELEGHSDTVRAVAFSPDGATVASGSYDRTIRIWNASTEGAENRLTGYHDSVESIAFSSDGTHITSGSWDGKGTLTRCDRWQYLLTGYT
ncbi:hypothetical protein C8R44DRAFT_864944 [Mycena epipterygia]|nr:hypothetical protein C8R44DRAFT_864944 [Mycena epipterygia]